VERQGAPLWYVSCVWRHSGLSWLMWVCIEFFCDKLLLCDEGPDDGCLDLGPVLPQRPTAEACMCAVFLIQLSLFSRSGWFHCWLFKFTLHSTLLPLYGSRYALLKS
jgi:hypothetical protein